MESPSKRLGMQQNVATNIIYNMDMVEIPDGGFQLWYLVKKINISS